MKKYLKILVGAALFVGGLTWNGTARAEVTDSALAQQVVESIRQYSHFSMFDDVAISVENHVVTLTGRVTRALKRDDIGQRVAKIDGVRQVVNDIEVLPLSPSDDALRLSIARAIYNHPSFWQYASRPVPPIHIIVEHGHVTLTGSVATQLDKAQAYSLAQVPGAFSVTDDLRIDNR